MKRILCVDAHSSGLDSVKAAAEQAGYEVVTAATGRRGLEVFAAEQIDGVLLDPRLPDMDGTAFSRELERMKPNVPLLVYNGPADATHTPLRCMDAYLQSPAPPDMLLARASRAVPRTHT
jgi:DNA-binding response OmpR family regulator